MDVSFETIAVLAVLLPGFLASAILNAVVVRKPLDSFSKLLEAFAFSAAIYSVPVVVVFVRGANLGGLQSELSSGHIPEGAGYFAVFVFLLTIVIPILAGASITHDLHMRLLRKLKITDKTARETVWFDVFTDISDRCVVVNLCDGRRLLGWPQYYANTPEEGTIYLFDPYWINNRGQNVSLGRHGILITKEMIETIEFVKESSSQI